MRDITIVIQGPQSIGSQSAANAHNYLSVGDVIVSCWEGDDLSGFEGLPVKIVQQKLPKDTAAANAQNVYFQTISTLTGMEAASTEYAIKVRSDEAYTDLTPIVNKMMKFPNKMITNNIYFRKDKEHKFHPSDHVIAGRRAALEGTFRILKEGLESHDKELAKRRPAETRIFLSFLRYHKVDLNSGTSKALLKEWCDVVPASALGSIIWSDFTGSHTKDTHYIKSLDDV